MFLFGGMAEMDEEPQRPMAEFAMAIAGPIASIVIGAVFYLIYSWGGDYLPVPLTEVLWYLAFINWVLAAFNLIPAYPLDGGRILRSALWRWKGDLSWATHKAANFGAGFGLVLILLGVVHLLAGNLVGGIWHAILGLFLRSAAQMSYQQVLMQESFEDVPVLQLIKQPPVTVSPQISIQELIDDYVYSYHFKMFPVVEGDRLLGCVTTRAVKEIPREQWSTTRVDSIIVDCAQTHAVDPHTPVTKALNHMKKNDLSRLMVVEDGRVKGIVSLKDILKAFSTRRELEE